MKIIYKQALAITDEQHLTLPEAAKVLHVAVQGGQLTLWYMFDAAKKKTETRTFRVVGTGHQIADAEQLTHLGTVLMSSYVWHVFEKGHHDQK
jgi:hypothetical protein